MIAFVLLLGLACAVAIALALHAESRIDRHLAGQTVNVRMEPGFASDAGIAGLLHKLGLVHRDLKPENIARPGLSIVLVDHTGTIPAAELARVAKALNLQAVDVGATPPFGYGVMYTVRAANAEHPPQPGEAIVALVADATQPSALGYHDIQADGTPVGFVFLLLAGSAWPEITGHEVIELAVDATCNGLTQSADGKLYAAEAADPVEQDTYTIDVDGAPMKLSNFVTPAWYLAPRDGFRYDRLGLCKHPGEVRPGGYAQVLDPAKGWQQLSTGERSAYRKAVAEMGHSRAARRKL